MKKSSHISLTELFLVKADWGRTFMGSITREKTAKGGEFVRGNVVINEGMAWSTGTSQTDLAKNLDDICVMKLDRGLHSVDSQHAMIAGQKLYSN